MLLDGHFKELGILDANATESEVARKENLITCIKVRSALFVHNLRHTDHFAVAVQDG